MKKQQKIDYLQENHFSQWIKTRNEADWDVSDSQSMFCCCGDLATGLHERHCKRFAAKVDAETIKRLKHLLPSKQKQSS